VSAKSREANLFLRFVVFSSGFDFCGQFFFYILYMMTETFTPVYPKGRVGTVIFSGAFVAALARAGLETLKGTPYRPYTGRTGDFNKFSPGKTYLFVGHTPSLVKISTE
jgi:hypothetical protein